MMDIQQETQTPVCSAVDWEAVYRDLLPRVYNFFRYRVSDSQQAEDLTAATFLKAWRARDQYSHDIGAFSTWLFSIARNVAIDYFRQRRADFSLDGFHHLPADSTLEEAVERRSDAARLAALLARLPLLEQELIALKYGAELTNRAIATITGLSESNVGTMLYRIIRRLREEWDKP
jgi:RNA polymerase sigma-70 factor (ECF subfamily)